MPASAKAYSGGAVARWTRVGIRQVINDRGSRWLLVILLIFEFGVLSRQLSVDDGTPSRVEQGALGAMAPLAHLVVAVQDGVSGFVARRRREVWLRQENRRLEESVSRLERELLRRQSVELDFQRLAEALRYSRESSQDLQVGDVVFIDHSSARRSLVLFVGGDGASVGQAVVDPRGLVGRVVVIRGGYAKVQLVSDTASAVGAMIERTRRQGVVRGTGPNALSMNYVPRGADVRVGDRIVSAGIDGIYPRGLMLGFVESVGEGTDLFHRIDVRPAVDFGLLDGAYLLPRVELPSVELGETPVSP
ncbi:MAG: rod shape-determining protein MreC [Thermoanaerobaculia bacterium]|nr:rod shape-determining protein MreC [Thermoanaerobaculia bacterium]